MAPLKLDKIDDLELVKSRLLIKDLMLFITLSCDLRCKICYLGNNWLNSNSTFPDITIYSLINHFGQKGLDRLTLLGGEPLLHPHITEFILFSQKYPIKQKRLTTNAQTLSNLDFNRLTGKELDHISVSFDGISAKTHDKIRGPGTFIKAIENSKILIKHGFKLHATYTVTSLNKHEVLETPNFFSKIGFSCVNYHLISMIGNAKNHPELYIEPTQWITIRDQLLGLTKPHGITLRVPLMYVTKDQYQKLLQKKSYHPFQRRSYHSSEGQRLVVYPNGKIYMSCDLTGTEYNFATFKNNKFHLLSNINELSLIKQNPEEPDPSSVLLGLDNKNLVRLSISYKKTILL